MLGSGNPRDDASTVRIAITAHPGLTGQVPDRSAWRKLLGTGRAFACNRRGSSWGGRRFPPSLPASQSSGLCMGFPSQRSMNRQDEWQSLLLTIRCALPKEQPICCLVFTLFSELEPRAPPSSHICAVFYPKQCKHSNQQQPGKHANCSLEWPVPAAGQV